VINIVRPQDLPGKLIHQVIFFVQAFSRSQYAEAISALHIAELCQLSGSNTQGSVPVNFDPLSPVRMSCGAWLVFKKVAAYAWPGESVGMMDEVIPVPPLDAQVHPVDWRVGV
jgi:hypothetical protein